MATTSGLKFIYIQWIVLILGMQLVPTGKIIVTYLAKYLCSIDVLMYCSFLL